MANQSLVFALIIWLKSRYFQEIEKEIWRQFLAPNLLNPKKGQSPWVVFSSLGTGPFDRKAIAIRDCSHKDLIEINNSVKDMADKITGLEIVLKAKLDLIQPIPDDCDKKYCEPER